MTPLVETPLVETPLVETQPTVSVLLPVKDAAPYLATCLGSLVRQTFRDFEVVAVDDGSTDGSGALLDRWALRDPRIRVLHRPHRGLVSALETGRAACRAPLIARMDADDRALPRRFAAQVDAFRRDPRPDVVSCWVRHVPRHRIGEGMRRYEAWLNSLNDHESIARERFVESPIAHPSAMVRRERLEAVGGYRERDWPEDHDLWLRLLAAGARFAKVPEVLLFWRDRGDRLTRTDRRYAKDRFLALKAHHLARGPLAGRPPVVIWGAGVTGKRLARHLAAEGIAVAAWLDIDPRKIGGTVRDARVHDAEVLETLIAESRPRPIVLAAVAARGARELIRARLVSWSLVEGRDFWCVV